MASGLAGYSFAAQKKLFGGAMRRRALGAVADAEPTRVGSKPQGNNIWGVSDLIGNVWELTSSELQAYPGSDVVQIKKPAGKSVVVRGGSANEDPVNSALKIDATFRTDVPVTKKDKTMGFRLVRSQ